MKRTVTLLIALVVPVLLVALPGADPLQKPQSVETIEITATPIDITPQAAPTGQGDHRDFCDGEWQGGMAYILNDWFYGDEYYAVYQDPDETGCPDAYPFEVTSISWVVNVYGEVTIDIQPLVYDHGGDVDVIGDVLCAGPLYQVTFPGAGAYILNLPFPEPCCAYGPYFAGIYVPTVLGFGSLDVVVDDGIVVPPRSNATYNDYGTGWLDLVDDVGLGNNLELWSEGFNSQQGRCGTSGLTIIDPDTMHAYEAHTIPVLTASIYVGDITDGHTPADIDPATIQINGGIPSMSTALLGSHPDFSGDVLEIECNMRDFILGYMTFWDTVSETYSVAGQYYDTTPFIFIGDVTLIGHTSGDLNLDGQLTVTDIVIMVGYLFRGEPAPEPLEVADLDHNGEVTVSDLLELIGRVF